MTSTADIDVAVQEAAAILCRGGIVAFPTETVYGLGADAENPEAVACLFMAKGRPADHPVIVHIGHAEQGDAPRSPGALPSHYAPRTPLVLVPPEDLKAEVARRLESGERVAVLARFVATPQVEWLFLCRPAFTKCVWLVMPADPGGYARELYARLHALDTLHADCLLVEAPPAEAVWQAVRDRLARAARARLD